MQPVARNRVVQEEEGRAVHLEKHIWTSCEVLSTWTCQLLCAEAVAENQTLLALLLCCNFLLMPQG